MRNIGPCAGIELSVPRLWPRAHRARLRGAGDRRACAWSPAWDARGPSRFSPAGRYRSHAPVRSASTCGFWPAASRGRASGRERCGSSSRSRGRRRRSLARIAERWTSARTVARVRGGGLLWFPRCFYCTPDQAAAGDNRSTGVGRARPLETAMNALCRTAFGARMLARTRLHAGAVRRGARHRANSTIFTVVNAVLLNPLR